MRISIYREKIRSENGEWWKLGGSLMELLKVIGVRLDVGYERHLGVPNRLARGWCRDSNLESRERAGR